MEAFHPVDHSKQEGAYEIVVVRPSSLKVHLAVVNPSKLNVHIPSVVVALRPSSVT